MYLLLHFRSTSKVEQRKLKGVGIRFMTCKMQDEDVAGDLLLGKHTVVFARIN